LVVTRGSIDVFVNLGGQPHTFPAADGSLLLAASEHDVVLAADRITVPPDAAAIVRRGTSPR
jgi:hypothetical protein